MAFKVIDIEPTPNPNALKFMLDGTITEAPISFLHREQSTGHALAEKLFAVSGVVSILMLGDFVTINKTADAHWDKIKSAVKKILAEKDAKAD